MLVGLDRPVREELGWVEALGQVVDAPIAVAPGDAEDAGFGERLEQGPDRVRRAPVPVDGGPRLEVGRGQGAVLADPIEQLLDERGVLVERAAPVRDARADPR